MRRQSNPITPQHACIPMQSFSGRFIFLHLSTIPRSDFPGSHGAKKHYRLFCFERARARYKVFIFSTLSFMAYANLATRPNHLETELTNITRRHFCSLPVFVLNIPLFSYLLSLIRIFSVNTRDRNAISSRQNAIFCRVNKSSNSLSLSLACFCRRKHPKINRSCS